MADHFESRRQSIRISGGPSSLVGSPPQYSENFAQCTQFYITAQETLQKDLVEDIPQVYERVRDYVTGDLDDATLKRKYEELDTINHTRCFTDVREDTGQLQSGKCQPSTLLERTEAEYERYVTELNDCLDAIHEAGFPDAVVEHHNAAIELSGKIHDALGKLRDEIIAGRPEPPESGFEDLVRVVGVTHLVDGDGYAVENRVIKIQSRYRSLYVRDLGEPNKVMISGSFRFIGNMPGKNTVGSSVNVEIYECDTAHAEFLLAVQDFDRESQPFLRLLQPLTGSHGEDSIEPIIIVMRSLIGDAPVDEALREGEERSKQALATRGGRTRVAFPQDSIAATKVDEKSNVLVSDHESSEAPSVREGPSNEQAKSNQRMGLGLLSPMDFDHGAEICHATFSADGTLFATAGIDGALKLWGATEGKLTRTLTHPTIVRCCAFSPDGHLIYCGLDNGVVYAWSVKEETKRTHFTDQEEAVLSIAVSPDGRRIATGGRDKVARLRDREGSLVSEIAEIAEVINVVDFGPTGETIGIVGEKGRVLMFERETGTQVWEASPNGGGSVIDICSTGIRVAAGLHGGGVSLWYRTTGIEICGFAGHPHTVTAIAFSKDGRFLVTGSIDSSVAVWDVALEKKVATLDYHKDWIRGVSFAPDGRIGTAAKDGTIRIWPPLAGSN